MRILAFDDETDILYLYKYILTKKGHEVMVYPNCAGLLDIISKTRPDVILMDTSMPGITGLEATALIKKNKYFSKIPVISCSAQGDISKGPENVKADYLLIKPFTMSKLEKCLERISH